MRSSAGRRAVVLWIVVGAAMLAACPTSRAPREYPRATSPYGEHTTLVLANGRSVTGELLAVTDTAWYLMVNGRVAAARAAAITSRTVDLGRRGVYIVQFSGGAGPDAKRTQAARDGARFPHGIPPAVMAALLARSSQVAVDNLGTTPP